MKNVTQKKQLVISPTINRSQSKGITMASAALMKKLAGSMSKARAQQWLRSVKKLRSEW